MLKVFLGGTVNDSTWRNELISLLKIDYFNPVVDEWNDAAYNNELRERKSCDFVLYCITPKMSGVYSIAEVVDDSNKHPEKTLFCVLLKDGEKEFEKSQFKSLMAVRKMILENGGKYFPDLESIAEYLNNMRNNS